MPLYLSEKSMCPPKATSLENITFSNEETYQILSIELERFLQALFRRADGHQLIKIKKDRQILDPTTGLSDFLALHPPLY